MATVAVFLALGGGAYAAIKLPANSVATKQVKDRSLLRTDFKAGQLPTGAQGPKGDSGPPGLPGAPGRDGASATNLSARVSASGSLEAGSGVTDVSDVAGGVDGDRAVTFNRDVSNCTWVGSSTSMSVADEIVSVGQDGTYSGATVHVYTYRAGGGVYQARGFAIAVFC